VQAQLTRKAGTRVAEEEFSELYQRAYRRTVLLAYATTGSMALAEEIVQDALVQLYKKWDTVTAKEAWLRRAVLSLATSRLRRHLMQRRLAADPPAAAAADDIAAANLRLLLAVLSPRQRAAVILRYYEDCSEAEIAATLACRPGTVKSLLSRAIDKLQTEVRHAHRS
jgi:RNA polymerase sigma factor (sigma-70 family)